MKRQPAAVTPTVTPVADVAATSAQARLPGANRQSPNHRRNSEGRFPADWDRAAQPGPQVVPTEFAVTAKRALPLEVAIPDVATPMRVGRRVAPETTRLRPTLHCDSGNGQAGKGRR